MINTETEMVRAALRVGLAVGVPSTIVAGILRGGAAAITAALTVAFVVGVFAVTGKSLGWAAERGPIAVQAVALGGFFIRLVAYAGLLVALRPVEAVDGHVAAVTMAIAMVAVLGYEARLVLRNKQFWFIDASARPAVAGADRKEHV